jgi:hypothetical protein
VERSLAEETLTAEARAALARARALPLSYGVRMYACPGEARRLLVVLGEAHMKLGPAAALGQQIVAQFELRGVETFQRDKVLAGGLLWVFIHVPRLALRALSFGLVKGSTITCARQLPSGATVELERTKAIPMGLHAASIYLALFFFVAFSHLALTAALILWPDLGDVLAGLFTWLTLAVVALEVHLLALIPAFALRRRSWSWLIHPAVGLVTTRDMLMAEGTVRMLEDHAAPAAVVVMGRAHLPGFERELVEKHGFRRIEP